MGHSISWSALHSYIAKAETDSAIMRETNPGLYSWGSRIKTNTILADIFDMLAMINTNIVSAVDHKRQEKPKPYPRPKEDADHYGEKAVPVAELRKMFANKRKQRINNV